jgi:hypothetical protein
LSDERLSLNGLLEASGYDLAKILVFRHRPWESALNKVFDWIVAERLDLFDCYQSTHGANTEAALSRATHVASFIRYKPKKALFVALYRIDGRRTLTVEAYQNRPLHRELVQLGMGGHKASDGRDSVIEFTTSQTGWNTEWCRRLIIDWPGLERSWYRWADRNQFPVSAIAEEPLLIAPLPDWQQLTLEWFQLGVLPTAWQAALAQWRGVYLIIDQSDGKQYVGSAYGLENILQRWLGYARTGHGGNKLLRNRDPNNFVFSILQRVSPDLPDSEVIDLESTWKSRLRSRAPFGLNEN